MVRAFSMNGYVPPTETYEDQCRFRANETSANFMRRCLNMNEIELMAEYRLYFKMNGGTPTTPLGHYRDALAYIAAVFHLKLKEEPLEDVNWAREGF